MTPPDCSAEFTTATFVPSAVAVAPMHPSAPPQSRDCAVTAASLAADISQLTRPRIALMVLATVVTSGWLTAGRGFAGPELLWLLIGTTLVAASSSVANQILERDADRLMPRTSRRPIAAGRLSVPAATMLATFLVVAGGLIMTLASGWQPAAAALATWLLYVAIYTPMKMWSPLWIAPTASSGVRTFSS